MGIRGSPPFGTRTRLRLDFFLLITHYSLLITHYSLRIVPFSINHQPSTILPALQAALRTLALPIRHPAKGLNLIGERLTALLNPNDRGQIEEDLVGRYLQTVAIRMARLGKPWKQVTDAEILAEVGVRKVIVAAGKSTRFSSGLARKQLVLGDGYSTLLLHARQAVGIHCCPDVIAVDAVVAWKCLKLRSITKAAFEKALDEIDLPKRARQKIFRALKLHGPSTINNAPPGPASGTLAGPGDDATLFKIQQTFSDNLSLSAKATTEQLFDDFLHALMQPIVDASDLPLKGCPETGEDVLLALARPWGPGEALIAALARLKKLKFAGQTRYVMPIYSDYAPALLPKYAPIYLQAYMEAVIEDATMTIGAKSPLDKVKDRGNILFEDHRPKTEDHRLQTSAIREWRDMTKEQQAECERRLQKSREEAAAHSNPHTPTLPHSHTFHHGLNAGVFVIDLAWAARQAARQHKEFDHPDPVKGKEHEYWYTDLVEIAARQRKSRHVVFLGPDAPSGCKDAKRIHQYHEDILDETKQALLGLGVQLDPSAKVRIRSKSPSFSIETAAERIFDKLNHYLDAPRQDNVGLFGDIFIEDGVTIGHGVTLDGRSKPVYLEGETYIGDGANITGSHVHNALVVPGGHLKGVERSTHRGGAALIRELAPKDQEGILRFIRSEIEKFLSRLKNRDHRSRALQATERLWQRPRFLQHQTAESLYRHAFAWLRYFSQKDPFSADKNSEINALRPLTSEHWARLSKHDFSDHDATRKIFKELTLLATQANLFDWQSPTVRALLGSNSGTPTLPSISSSRLAIDHYAGYESMVFSGLETGATSTFLYLTDNMGETLFDALIWLMLCEIGHTVVVAAKDKPAGGDATVEDVMAIIKKRKALKQHFERGNLRAISNGNDTYGTFLDRLPEEFLAVYRDPSLRAIIGKGQANFYTTVVRNKLDAPFVAQFLVKGMTAEKTTGIRLRRNKDGKKVPRPVIAILPPGECVTEVAPGMPGARTLKEMVNG